MIGPVIEGSRFRLRPLRLEDAGLICGWLEDLEVTARFQVRFPLSLEAEEEWLRAHFADPAFILWGVEHEGRLVGTTSIGFIDWPNQHGTTGTLIGDKTAWRKGIAGEMMKLRADFAFLETTLRKLCSGYIEGNEASRRAQEAAGYREVGRQRQHFFRGGRWIDHIITELLREDWERGRNAPPPDSPGR